MPRRLVSLEEADRLVPEIVRRELGVVPHRTERIAGGHNRLWDVSLGDRSVFVKSGQSDPAVEAWGCRKALEAGVSAPEPLALESAGSFPYLILSKLPGEPLPNLSMEPEARRRVLSETGSQLSLLHSVATRRFGLPYETHFRRTGHPKGTSPTWYLAITRWVNGRLSLLERAGALDSSMCEAIRASFQAHKAALEGVRESRLIHGDLRFANILVGPDDGSLSGIIDFEAIMFGDPAYDLAILTYQSPADLEAILQGYGDAPAVEGDLAVRLGTYRLIRAVLELDWAIAAKASPNRVRRCRKELVNFHLALDGA